VDLADRLDRLEGLALGLYEFARGSAREHLQSIAEATRQAVFDAAKFDPTPQPEEEQLIAEAMRFVSDTQPDFESKALAVRVFLAEKQIDLMSLIQSGDVLGISKLLISANTHVNVSRQDHEMKRRAQTISGGSQKPAVVDSDTAYWNSVKTQRLALRESDAS
jgi:hypothetical protein